jgi:hypothetical protein
MASVLTKHCICSEFKPLLLLTASGYVPGDSGITVHKKHKMTHTHMMLLSPFLYDVATNKCGMLRTSHLHLLIEKLKSFVSNNTGVCCCMQMVLEAVIFTLAISQQPLSCVW